MSLSTPKRHTPLPNLPQDAIMEILKRLPVKFLLQLRCVSKAWLALISSSEFAKLHLNFHSRKDNKIVTFNIVNQISRFISLFSITENKKSSYRRFITYDRSIEVPEGGFEFLGSCNGLLCFRAKPYKIIIWNPSNGNIKTISDVWRVDYVSICGFGYDENNDDYKVVYAYHSYIGEENEVLVYSFKYGAWKKIEKGFIGGFVYPKIAVFVSGTLNWCNNNLDNSDLEWNIISFNLGTETAKAIALPNYEQGAAVHISESRGLLFVGFHHKCQMEVWVMNEYGVEESWSKLVSISNLPKHYPFPRGLQHTAYMGMCIAKLSIPYVSENVDVLMKVGHQLKLHRPKAKRGKNFNIPMPYTLGRYMATSYLETLVSP